MANIIGDLYNEYGHSQINTAATPNQAFNTSATAKPKATGPMAYAKNVATSAVKIPLSLTQHLVGGAIHDVSQGFSDVAHGITQGLPHIGSIAQNQKYVDHSLSQIDAAHKSYAHDYASGKIDKVRYNKLLKGLSDDYASVSKQSTDNTKTVKPADFAKGLATVAALPFAGGNLVGESAAAKALGATAEAKNGVAAAVKAPIKYAAVTQPVAQAPLAIATDLKHGNLKGAAGNAAILAAPVALAAGSKILPKVGTAAKEAMVGRRSFLDEIPTSKGKITDFLNSKEGASHVDLAKQFQEYNLKQSGGDVGKAVDKYVSWVGKDKAATLSPAEHLTLFKQFNQDINAVRDAARSGSLAHPGGKAWTEKEINNLWVGRFDQNVKSGLVSKLGGVADSTERQALAAKLADQQHWGKNSILRDKVIKAAGKDDFEKRINKITGTRSLAGPTEKETELAAIADGKQTLSQPVQSSTPIPRNLSTALDSPGESQLAANRALNAARDAAEREKAGLPAPKDNAPVSTEQAAQEQAAFDNIAKPKQLKLGQGHIPILRDSVKTQIPQDVSNVALVAGKQAAPGIGKLGSALTKAGVGIEDYNPKQFGIFKENLGNNVENAISNQTLDRIGGKQGLLDGLQELSDKNKLTDFRQLHLNELMQHFDLSKSEAKAIRSSMDKAWTSVPTSMRGMANKLQDFNMKANPLARKYARAQGTLRYRTPFFKAQQTIEANTLGAAISGGSKFATKDVSDTVRSMRDSGFLPQANSAYAGESTEAITGAAKVTSHLQPTEERALARTLLSIANRDGTKVEDLLKDDQTRRLLRTVVQYDNKGLQSSNLTKAVNIATFPAAYNAKVTALAVKALAKQPPAMQFAIVKGIADYEKFLKTDDGVKWKRDNSELIGLVNYFSPLNSIESFAKFIGSRDMRDLGVVGGLPFGVISRVLQGQGVGPQQPSYVDPKTGQVVPSRIPTTLSGHAKQFLRDALDTVFTYPGRQAGLGSKGDLIDTVTGKALKLNPNESKPAPIEIAPRDQKLAASSKQSWSAPLKTKPINQMLLEAPKTNVKHVPITPIYKAAKPGSAKVVKVKNKAVRPGEPF